MLCLFRTKKLFSIDFLLKRELCQGATCLLTYLHIYMIVRYIRALNVALTFSV